MKTMTRCLVMVLFVGTISTQAMAQWVQTNGPHTDVLQTDCFSDTIQYISSHEFPNILSIKK